MSSKRRIGVLLGLALVTSVVAGGRLAIDHLGTVDGGQSEAVALAAPVVGSGATRATAGAASVALRVGFVRNHSVYSIRPDGGGLRLVLRAPPPGTSARALYSEPAWSPDGTLLAVHATTFESHEYQHVWVFDRTAHHIATFDSLYGPGGDSPSWAPDGKRLVFADFWSGGWIYMAGIATPVRSLVDHFGAPPYDANPAWSPRGTLIAFSRSTAIAVAEGASDFQGVLYVVGVNGKGLRPVTTHVGVNPTWSPDGGSVAFDDHRRIGVIDTNGKRLRYIIRDGTYPSWSPDGAMIAFERRNDLWLYRFPDKSTHLLVRNAHDPTWISG